MSKSSTPMVRRIRRRIRPLLGTVLDLLIGIESTTQHFVQPSDDPRMNRYQASYWLSVVVGMRGIQIGGEDVFVDFGCGKGRALYLACWYPFHQVIGVECDSQLASVARRNMAQARGPRSLRTVQIIDADARFVELPDNLRVAFFFNPFRGAVFRTVAERLKNHADKRQSPLRVIYANPTERGALLKLGFVVVRESEHCSVFDYLPSSAC